MIKRPPIGRYLLIGSGFGFLLGAAGAVRVSEGADWLWFLIGGPVLGVIVALILWMLFPVKQRSMKGLYFSWIVATTTASLVLYATLLFGDDPLLDPIAILMFYLIMFGIVGGLSFGFIDEKSREVRGRREETSDEVFQE